MKLAPKLVYFFSLFYFCDSPKDYVIWETMVQRIIIAQLYLNINP